MNASPSFMGGNFGLDGRSILDDTIHVERLVVVT